MPLKLGNVMDAAIGKNYSGVVCLLVHSFLLYAVSAIIIYFKNLESSILSIKISEEIKNRIVSKAMVLPMKDIDLLEKG